MIDVLPPIEPTVRKFDNFVIIDQEVYNSLIRTLENVLKQPYEIHDEPDRLGKLSS
jgi:hypothetical protein